MLEEPHHRARRLRELRIRSYAVGDPFHDWYDVEGPSLLALLAGLIGANRHPTLRVLALPRVEELFEAELNIGHAHLVRATVLRGSLLAVFARTGGCQ